ncbi:MAG: hypothetical protein BV458_03485 [Thermoplasmata archaeon M9B2D]|nr:MAG: hypothetical protein BV458_03485 [Thermoplasmata archaeon M9B2D]
MIKEIIKELSKPIKEGNSMFKVGDKVEKFGTTSVAGDKGIVIHISTKPKEKYPVIVEFDCTIESFTTDGRYWTHDAITLRKSDIHVWMPKVGEYYWNLEAEDWTQVTEMDKADEDCGGCMTDNFGWCWFTRWQPESGHHIFTPKKSKRVEKTIVTVQEIGGTYEEECTTVLDEFIVLKDFPSKGLKIGDIVVTYLNAPEKVYKKGEFNDVVWLANSFDGKNYMSQIYR